MRIGIVTRRATETNTRLAAATPVGTASFVVAPEEARHRLGPGDVALGRLDVLPTLAGIEPGLWHLDRLEESGVAVLNRPPTLRLAHDKLATASALEAASLPHPRTRPLFDADAPPPLPLPLVLKPRYGSWGRDVVLCPDEAAYRRALAAYRRRAWFETCGAVAQELVPPRGHDLRIVVADREVVGTVKRVARAGEWRTNVALGATRVPAEPPPAATELALAAAAAVGGDLVGVDLLPLGPGRYAVLELNGAVDFSDAYSFDADVFGAAMDALVRSVARTPPLLPELAEAGGW
jgi:[lysine-biosynthesis-protein LysW]---L-2-aminoadipate ligase